MICEKCGEFVKPYSSELIENKTARVRRYVCLRCGHRGEQWDSLQRNPQEKDKK